VNPDHSLEPLPQPSVAEGVLSGAVVGGGGRELFLHYSGRVDGVNFLESSINEITVPPEGMTKLFTSEVHVDEEIPYAPGAPGAAVVPEPTSLLLLGSALAAAGLRARRAARSRRC
jgi:PEP-CTERM motif